MLNNKAIEPRKIGPNFFTERDHKIVREAMPNLSETERTVVYLRFWAGLCEFEIAEVLKVKEAVILDILRGACDGLKGELMAHPDFSRCSHLELMAS